MTKSQVNKKRKTIIEDVARVLNLYPLPELSGKRIFITGGTGFIGYWLLTTIAKLNEQGSQISVVSLSRSPDRFLESHAEFKDANWLKFIRGDIQNYPFPEESFDFFIHGATDTSPEAANHSLELFESILQGTRHVLNHAVACGTRRVLLISSGAVYGEQPPEVTKTPENATFSCSSTDIADAYGEGKRSMEMLAACYAHTYKLEPVFARCFAFIGYGLPAHLAVSQLINSALNAQRIVITGDGKSVRSYLYAADLAIWLLALTCKGKAGQPYNVGADENYNLLELAKLINKTLNLNVPIEILGASTQTKRTNYIPNISLIKQELGLQVWTNTMTGIKRMAEKN